MTVPATARLRELVDVLIVETFYLEPRVNGPHYEIHVAREYPSPLPPRRREHVCDGCTVLVTRDERIYTRAQGSLGTLHRFVARWASGTQPDGTRVQVLLELEAK